MQAPHAQHAPQSICDGLAVGFMSALERSAQEKAPFVTPRETLAPERSDGDCLDRNRPSVVCQDVKLYHSGSRHQYVELGNQQGCFYNCRQPEPPRTPSRPSQVAKHCQLCRRPQSTDKCKHVLLLRRRGGSSAKFDEGSFSIG